MKAIMTINIHLLMILFASFMTMANNMIAKSAGVLTALEEIKRVQEWTEYKKFGGVKIEYKFQDCDSQDLDKFRNLTVVLFRFSNLTDQKLELFWSRVLYFDSECVNCEKIKNEEHAHSIKLKANQIIEADCTSKVNKSLYISANFIKLSPGMSGTKLTDFKFINLRSSVWK